MTPFTKHGVIFMKLNGIELLNLAVAHELREVWVVRLDLPDQPGNRGPDGDLLWLEVLLCKSSDDATHLAEYLSKAAFDDFSDLWPQKKMGNPFSTSGCRLVHSCAL
uniref:hypothetical protein n=1 Tax=Vibrio cholerae TaxID=666 RepID=UPI003F5824F0